MFFNDKKAFVNRYTQHLKPYEIKTLGRIKGLPKKNYCCPKTNKWIEDRFCEVCKCCGFKDIFHINKKETASHYYCCYPREVNDRAYALARELFEERYNGIPTMYR